MLQALATDALRDRREEAVDLLDRQPTESTRICVIAEELEQLGHHRRMICHRRLGEPSHLVEMISVFTNKELAPGLDRHRRGEYAARGEELRKRTDQSSEVHVVLRIARREREQLGSRQLLQPANTSPAQARVDSRHGPNPETDRPWGVSGCMQPDDEVLDERTQEWQRGEVGVATGIEIDEHDGLREGRPRGYRSVMWSRSAPAISATDGGDVEHFT